MGRSTSQEYELENESVQVNKDALDVEFSQWVKSRLGTRSKNSWGSSGSLLA